MVLNDPKGELYAASKETLEALGYHVEVLNLMNPNQSMSYDLLEIVKQEFLLENYSQAQQYARSLSFMLYHDPKSSDQIWSKASTNLCTALILGLCEVNKKTNKFTCKVWNNTTATSGYIGYDYIAIGKWK